MNCIGCSDELIAALDADPNGDMNCVCARCRAEENHDFDAEPLVTFRRNGDRVESATVLEETPEQTIARLQVALEFYANRDNWRSGDLRTDPALVVLNLEYFNGFARPNRRNGWEVAELALRKCSQPEPETPAFRIVRYELVEDAQVIWINCSSSTAVEEKIAIFKGEFLDVSKQMIPEFGQKYAPIACFEPTERG